ncbi:MAG: fatty acid hydroxylase, partial [Candidatus Sedimenticola endophacoides]
MNEYILTNEPSIRIGFFLGVFVLVALWELASPKRPLSTSKAGRWLANIAVVALNTLLLRLLFPAAAVGVALFAQNHGWGLFNAIDAPLWLALPASVVLLDFAIWLQHV